MTNRLVITRRISINKYNEENIFSEHELRERC